MADRTVILDIIGRDNASKAFDSSGKAASKSSQAVSKASKVARVALLGMAVGAVALGKDAVSAASDLNETMSKSQVVLGSAAGAVQKWADTSATALGQSKQQALDAATGFAVFGKSAGLSGKDLAGFSTGLTGLASDMASFSNTSPEQAIEAIGAALRGESEPIRAYGVMLDAASVKAKAMSMGLVKASKDTDKIQVAQIRATTAQARYNKAVKEHGKSSMEAKAAEAGLISSQAALKKAVGGSIPDLTQQQKVLATQALIMDQTKDAQGDFARTSTGLANKQRILAAQVENLKAKLGQGLLPIVQSGVGILMNLATWVSNNEGKAKALAATIVAVTAAVAGINVIAKVVTAATKAWAAAQWLINVAMTANPIGLVIVAIAGLAVALVLAYKKSDKFRAVVQTTFGWIKSHWPLLLAIIAGPIGIATALIIKNWSKIKSAAQILAESVKLSFYKIGLAVGHTIEKILNAASKVPGIGSKFRSARDAVRSSNASMQRSIDASRARVQSLRNSIAGIRSKSVTITVNTAMKNQSGYYDVRNHGVPRAGGGRALAGRTYQWQEQGRELFVPDTNGRVMSASQVRSLGSGGGGVTVIIQTPIAVGSQREFRNMVISALGEAKGRGA